MNNALPWAGADADCQEAGLQLATVQSAAQNEQLVTAAAGNRVWIGGTDAASEGTWVWSPSNTPLSYTNWYPGEPSGGGEDCLEFNFRISGKWNDVGCARERKYVCQTACPVPPPPPSPPPSPPSSPLPPPASKFAVITATQNSETLPYGPGPIGTKPAYFCTDCIGSTPSDSWTETVACDGSNVDMTIVYQFDSAMSAVWIVCVSAPPLAAMSASPSQAPASPRRRSTATVVVYGSKSLA
jgi:hypothetical protein